MTPLMLRISLGLEDDRLLEACTTRPRPAPAPRSGREWRETMWMIERLRDGYLQARESGPLNEGATLVQKFATAEEATAARDEMYDPGGRRRAAFEARVATESAAAMRLHRFRSECRERGRLPDDGKPVMTALGLMSKYRFNLNRQVQMDEDAEEREYNAVHRNWPPARR